MKIEMGKKYAFRGGPRYGTYELLRTDLGGLVPVLGIRTETNGGKCALFHTFEGKVVLTNSNSQSRHPLDLIEVTPYSHIHTELSKVEKQRDMLLEALKRYGRHQVMGEMCAVLAHGDNPCTCGLDAAIAAVEMEK